VDPITPLKWGPPLRNLAEPNSWEEAWKANVKTWMELYPQYREKAMKQKVATRLSAESGLQGEEESG